MQTLWMRQKYRCPKCFLTIVFQVSSNHRLQSILSQVPSSKLHMCILWRPSSRCACRIKLHKHGHGSQTVWKSKWLLPGGWVPVWNWLFQGDCVQSWEEHLWVRFKQMQHVSDLSRGNVLQRGYLLICCTDRGSLWLSFHVWVLGLLCLTGIAKIDSITM